MQLFVIHTCACPGGEGAMGVVEKGRILEGIAGVRGPASFETLTFLFF